MGGPGAGVGRAGGGVGMCGGAGLGLARTWAWWERAGAAWTAARRKDEERRGGGSCGEKGEMRGAGGDRGKDRCARYRRRSGEEPSRRGAEGAAAEKILTFRGAEGAAAKKQDFAAPKAPRRKHQ